MSSKKAQKLKIQAVQKEQVQLVQIENILTNLLSQVNESINELKVEELQIKSSLIEQYTSNDYDELPTTSAQAASRHNSILPTTDPLSIEQTNIKMDMEGIDDINKQILALETLLVPLKKEKYKEEEEEEYDDDEDEEEDDEYRPSDEEK
ncbi:uncharacterized protein LOC119613465 [Lucilia sericata]|uniref:uncharacterized protein LOC119613465 n=1 Tax=Lucilia sericata TaxID=13632 RepID=UPI0018A84C57|nr:uncharacterized protein LOC119613465 [Lucilia sericata]